MTRLVVPAVSFINGEPPARRASDHYIMFVVVVVSKKHSWCGRGWSNHQSPTAVAVAAIRSGGCRMMMDIVPRFCWVGFFVC
jgi:hypothetical protein